jgi:glucosamine-6-phosphate deaminase
VIRLVVHSSEARAAQALADFVARALTATPDLVLGLPAGRTPVAFYRALVARHVDFSKASTFNLDELAGLDPDDRRSYHAFVRRHLLDHVNIRAARAHALNGAAKNWRRELDRYERELATAGGLDLAIVGIGLNGHIAFNEPAAALQARTHLVRLHPETRRANAAAFGRAQDVPAHGLTMGMATILNASSVVLLASGRTKARVLRRALTGPVTTRLPASLLQLHPNVLAVLDRAAAAGLVADQSASGRSAD